MEFSETTTERINAAKEKIANGAKWNGTVYGQKGRNNTKCTIYLNGDMVYLTTVSNADAKEVKQSLEQELKSVAVCKNADKELTAYKVYDKKGDGYKIVHSKMSYGEMLLANGMNVE